MNNRLINEEKDETIYSRENIPRVGNFEKVSFSIFEQSLKDLGKYISKEEAFATWKNIQLPERSTAGSAGYDLRCPLKITLPSNGGGVVIPTGIRAKIHDGWVLMIYPRSGLGFKHGAALQNTCGIIDAEVA